MLAGRREAGVTQRVLPVAGRTAARRRVSAERLREAGAAYLFLLPTIVGLLLFTAGPVLASAYVSFTRWDLLSATRWNGARNYTALLHAHPFWVSVRNTLHYPAISVPAGRVCARL